MPPSTWAYTGELSITSTGGCKRKLHFFYPHSECSRPQRRGSPQCPLETGTGAPHRTFPPGRSQGAQAAGGAAATSPGSCGGCSPIPRRRFRAGRAAGSVRPDTSTERWSSGQAFRPVGFSGVPHSLPSSPWWNPALHRERRGARLTRREEGAYWAYVTDEQRSQAGCIAARMQRGFSPRARCRQSGRTPRPSVRSQVRHSAPSGSPACRTRCPDNRSRRSTGRPGAAAGCRPGP